MIKLTMRQIAEKVILEKAEKGAFDILDRYFVDDFILKTGCKFKHTMLGANKCAYLGRTLSRMYSDGLLERGTIGIDGMGYGFPTWVYVYSKPKVDEVVAQ